MFYLFLTALRYPGRAYTGKYKSEHRQTYKLYIYEITNKVARSAKYVLNLDYQKIHLGCKQRMSVARKRM